jgi:hypothetical protein
VLTRMRCLIVAGMLFYAPFEGGSASACYLGQRVAFAAPAAPARRVSVANDGWCALANGWGDELNTGANANPPRGLDPSTQWVLLLRTSEIAVFLDSTRVVRLALGEQRVWLRTVYAQPQPDIDHPGHTYASGEVLIEIDCARKVARELVVAIYNASGGRIGAHAADKPVRHSFAKGLGAPVFEATCTWLEARAQLPITSPSR